VTDKFLISKKKRVYSLKPTSNNEERYQFGKNMPNLSIGNHGFNRWHCLPISTG